MDFQKTPDVRMKSWDDERLADLVFFHKKVGSFYGIGLMMAFWVADYIWYREFFIEFGVARTLSALVIFCVTQWISTKRSLRGVQIATTMSFVSCAYALIYMLYKIDLTTSPYFYGFGLVVVGLGSGPRFDAKFHLINTLMLFVPFVTLGWYLGYTTGNNIFHLNLITILSFSLVTSMGKSMLENTKALEYAARVKLSEEIETRGAIIKEKTEIAVQLHSLSKQFSPQIIQSLERGEINLHSEIHRSEIGAIFIDIKDSTAKFVSLEKDNLQKVLSMYMNDVMDILLKYDITFDKFLGDGILGFSNDPASQPDYLEKVLGAGLDIIDRLKERREDYIKYWLSDFEVRIGISSGNASVGFYGSDRHVKSYTAIGKVMNLASRVNGVAGANEIAVSQDVLTKLIDSGSKLMNELTFTEIHQKSLKGFESEIIRLLKVERKAKEATTNLVA